MSEPVNTVYGTLVGDSITYLRGFAQLVRKLTVQTGTPEPTEIVMFQDSGENGGVIGRRVKITVEFVDQ